MWRSGTWRLGKTRVCMTSRSPWPWMICMDFKSLGFSWYCVHLCNVQILNMTTLKGSLTAHCEAVEWIWVQSSMGLYQIHIGGECRQWKFSGGSCVLLVAIFGTWQQPFPYIFKMMEHITFEDSLGFEVRILNETYWRQCLQSRLIAGHLDRRFQ